MSKQEEFSDLNLPTSAASDLEFTSERSHRYLHRYLFAQQFCRGKRILDIASHEGSGTRLLSDVAQSAVGVDISPTATDRATQRYGREGLEYQTGDCLAIPARDDDFDVVVSFGTIEHKTPPDEFLAEVRRVLRPDGILVMSSPDCDSHPPGNQETTRPDLQELDASGFRTRITREFQRAVFADHKASSVSLMAPNEGSARRITSFIQSADGQIERHHAIAKALCVICVASNGDLPVVDWGLLDAPFDAQSLRDRIDLLQSDLAASKADAAAARAETAAAQAESHAMRSSLIWRLARPLRMMTSLARIAGSFPIRAVVSRCVRLVLDRLPRGLRDWIKNLHQKMVGRSLARPNFDSPRMALALKRLIADLAATQPEGTGITHLVTVPFLSSGGADLTATNYLRAIAELSAPTTCLLVVADLPQVTVENWLPDGVRMVKIDDYLPRATQKERVDFLDGLVRTIQPQVLHNVNSITAWQLIIHRGNSLKRSTRLFGSIFAFQFAPDGGLTGYASDFFERARPHLTGLLTDNARFAKDLSETYRLDDTWRKRIHVIYNPSRALGHSLPAAKERKPGEPLRALWAGRMDAEKLPKVFAAIVARADFVQFDAFGATVVEGRHPLKEGPRLRLHGPFSNIQEMLAEGRPDVFVFTSKWEGLPNILLEIGALGIPIIAPNVGGVAELIDATTGYLIERARDVDGYVAALREIHAAPDEALRRGECLAARIRERHCWQSFRDALSLVPEYV